MEAGRNAFWKTYLTGLQLHVIVAEYTKVPVTWNEDNYTTDVNKLYFIQEGEGYIKVGNRQFYPKPGDLCLMPADKVQSYGTTSANTFGKYWCHFTAKLNNFNLFQLLEAPILVPVAERLRLEEKFERLIHHHKSEEWTASLHVQAALLEILALFLEQAEQVNINTPAAGSFEKMNAVLTYIEEHLSENITVDSLAQLVHFHPNYFIRMFKNTTGLSPIQYVNRKRMDKARQLLSFTAHSISEIAETLGMDAAYFSRLFKESTALTPSEYREISLK
ncbi:AraC-like DNA-binding protein [Paenibacillus castaneae]|uniref:AraC family transcriptional regulator n=1 Tax=Paenibacillus castaneae TaxID=474957 RepID=UPI0011AECBFF|nr:AraC family transcriptional regulator [Paenibacillus castaneae]NIK77836.1 AraC-like DNA-binding protein [Paenibacillus castaneae]